MHEMHYKQKVLDKEAGMRLDRYLRLYCGQVSQSVIEKSLRSKKIRLNDLKVKSSHRVETGDEIIFPKNLSVEDTHEKKQEYPLTEKEKNFFKGLIIADHNDFLVLNKPSGLAVQGGTKTKRHIDYYLQKLNKEQKTEYRLVHRLDRDTSGLLLVAKNHHAARYLTERFRENEIQKTYLAIVQGDVTKKKGIIDAPLMIGKKADKEKMIVSPDGKPSLTHYEISKVLDGDIKLLALSPKTGRKHQLRAHLSHVGLPILGDVRYNPTNIRSQRMMLHAQKISFTDLSGKKCEYSASMPDHMKTIVEGGR